MIWKWNCFLKLKHLKHYCRCLHYHAGQLQQLEHDGLGVVHLDVAQRLDVAQHLVAAAVARVVVDPQATRPPHT